MRQQNRRGQIPKRVMARNFRGSNLKLPVPQNVSAELADFWRRLAEAPVKVLLGMLAFVATIVPLVEAIAKLFGWDSGGGGGYSGSYNGSGSTLGGLLSFLTSTTPLTFVTCMVVCCSIGWSWALLTTWLTSARNRGRFGVLTIVVSAFLGLLLSSWCMTSLFRERAGDVGFADSLALLLTTMAIGAAVFLGKAKFVSMHETDPFIIGRRASALAVFTLSAVMLAVVATVDRLS